MSRVSGGLKKWSSETGRPHTGACAVQRLSGGKMRPENETSASFALQLSATGLFCGLYHTLIMIVPGSVETLLDSILSC